MALVRVDKLYRPSSHILLLSLAVNVISKAPHVSGKKKKSVTSSLQQIG